MTFRSLRQATAEAGAAAVWYEAERPDLGDDFFSELERGYESIRRNPRGLPRLEYYDGPHEVRRFLMRRFPYGIMYLCRPEEIVVVAVAHLKRRPLYWLGRIE